MIEILIEPEAIDQVLSYSLGGAWAQAQGVIVAPETSHEVAAVIQKAELDELPKAEVKKSGKW